MKSNQQKSFASGSMTQSNRQMDLAGAAIVWVLRKSALILGKLFVAGKYQFYKTTGITPSAVKLPWLKLGIVGFLAFFIFKRDVSVTVGTGEPMAQFGNGGFSEEVVLKTPGEKPGILTKVTSFFVKKDPFADDPADTEKDKRIKAYVRKFKDVAIAEKEKYGIPASIKMAQAIVESNAGASPLSTKNNNHFGIKCFSRTCKKGHCSNFGDDSHKDFFRKYGSNWESFRAHSQLIVNGKYKSLLKHGDNYRKWAHGLKSLGYATAKHYDNTLIEMIEKYQLDALDE